MYFDKNVYLINDYLSVPLVHPSEFVIEIRRPGLLDSRLTIRRKSLKIAVVGFFYTKKKKMSKTSPLELVLQ